MQEAFCNPHHTKNSERALYYYQFTEKFAGGGNLLNLSKDLPAFRPYRKGREI
jgi:hypothetical protein